MAIKSIYIDVGHGKTGEDSGASAVSGPTKYYENERNLRIARACRDRLESYGYSVTMSRTTNVNTGNLVGSYNRADSNLINSANACKAGKYDAMISIHCNDASNTKARGYWLCYKNDATSKDLCNAIADGFDKRYEGKLIPRNSINTNYTSYGILRLHDKPGVLVECGFMSNTVDLHEILCNYKLIGEAIAEGIANKFGKKIDNSVSSQDASYWKNAYTDLQNKYGEIEKKLAEEQTARKDAEAKITKIKDILK